MVLKTPDKLYQRLNAEFQFNLDAAADFTNRKCKAYFNENDDALEKDWNVFENTRVWLNPPGGRRLWRWTKKASQQKCLVVALLPASTETDWFKEYIFGKAEIRFINRRLRFPGQEGTSTKGSMVVIWGVEPCVKIMEKV